MYTSFEKFRAIGEPRTVGRPVDYLGFWSPRGLYNLGWKVYRLLGEEGGQVVSGDRFVKVLFKYVGSILFSFGLALLNRTNCKSKFESGYLYIKKNEKSSHSLASPK